MGFVFGQVPAKGVGVDEVIDCDQDAQEGNQGDQDIGAITCLPASDDLPGALGIEQEEERQADQDQSQADLDR